MLPELLSNLLKLLLHLLRLLLHLLLRLLRLQLHLLLHLLDQLQQLGVLRLLLQHWVMRLLHWGLTLLQSCWG